MEYISIVISIVTLVLLLYVIFRKQNGANGFGQVEDNKKQLQAMKDSLDREFDKLAEVNRIFNDNIIKSIRESNVDAQQRINEIEMRVNNVLTANETRLNNISQIISEGLSKMQVSNEQKLEQMRATVDEKLSTTLKDRFDESFKSIVETLASITERAGEMKSVVDSVSDFKRMITNVKTRGVWGEVQLGNVLEQMLSPNQYESQVSIDGSKERVDFVVKLPGKSDDEIIYLPIDAKFPLEDYSRLCEASETGDIKIVEQQSKQLLKRIKEEAKAISEKYIKLPKTTEFAVMYLPVEGLYAEIVKDATLCETLQRDYRIIVCGPNTVTALLSSLQMGFKTLAIEKRSGEIWKLLGMFKQEFNKFVGLLDKTQKKLNEASDTIDDATKKTKTIQRKLKSVADIDPQEQIDSIDFDEE